MWRFLWKLTRKKPQPKVFRSINFVEATKDHRAVFVGGNCYDARFDIRGQIAYGDEILVRMRSGRIGRYRVFSVQKDFSGNSDWLVRATGVGYQETSKQIPQLPCHNARWVRSDTGELAHLPSGFTKPASEFWKILVRDQASRDRTNSMRTTGNL